MPLRNSLFKDLFASLVVFLIAIPLCLGISIACGVSPTIGLITGIVGGLVVGPLSGCKLQVSGPAAGLITIIYGIIQTHGILQLSLIVFLAGLLQVCFSFLKWGQWFRAMSPAVIQGMLAGIGILIFSSQFHVMIDDTPKSNGVENLLTIPQTIIKGLFPVNQTNNYLAVILGLLIITTALLWNYLSTKLKVIPLVGILATLGASAFFYFPMHHISETTHHLAACIGIVTITVMLLWNLLPDKIKIVPAPLVGIIAAVGISAFFQLPINYISISNNIFGEIRFLQWDQLGNINISIIISTLTLALVASAESLLSANAVDRLSDTRTNYDKELFAQGVGNTIIGIIGGLPITGVIVRSSANIQAGAVTRLSSIFHGIWLLLFLMCFPFALEVIPISGLAAILVFTGCKLVNPSGMKNLLRIGKSEVFICIVTMIAIVVTNLLQGILIGFGLTAIKLLISLSALKIKKVDNQDTINVSMEGNANFISFPRLASTLENIKPEQNIHVSLSLNHIDYACMEFISKWEKSYKEHGEVSIDWGKRSEKKKLQKEGVPIA